MGRAAGAAQRAGYREVQQSTREAEHGVGSGAKALSANPRRLHQYNRAATATVHTQLLLDKVTASPHCPHHFLSLLCHRRQASPLRRGCRRCSVFVCEMWKGEELRQGPSAAGTAQHSTAQHGRARRSKAQRGRSMRHPESHLPPALLRPPAAGSRLAAPAFARRQVTSCLRHTYSPVPLANLAALFFLETRHPRTQPLSYLAIGQHGGGALQAAARGCWSSGGCRLILRLLAGSHGQGPAQMDVVEHKAIACSAAAASPCTVLLPQSSAAGCMPAHMCDRSCSCSVGMLERPSSIHNSATPALNRLQSDTRFTKNATSLQPLTAQQSDLAPPCLLG